MSFILNIFSTIIVEQIKQTIHRLLNDKVLKLNNILNEVLKIVILFIKNHFTQIISRYFVSKLIFKSF